MTRLPEKTLLDGTKTPETTTGEFRLAMGNLRQYLADLLGEDSADKATARETLGAAEKYEARAEGTGDAIVARFDPPIDQPVDTLTVFVRAKEPNTTAIPTFKADDTDAVAVVKGNDLPLLPGDIAGEGHWLELRYDETLRKWVLQNPARGIQVLPSFDVGTTMLFVQSTAPVGWLKRTTDNDKALRVVSGAAGFGGTVPFTDAFTARSATVSVNGTVSISGSVDATTLTVNQMPAHGHSVGGTVLNSGNSIITGNGRRDVVTRTTDNTGGNAPHTHSLNLSAPLSASGSIAGGMDFSVQYVDVIIAMKVEE